MNKHNGCFVCGGGHDETLRSMPDMTTMTSIALCAKCWALPNDALKAKVVRIREAMAKARQEAAGA